MRFFSAFVVCVLVAVLFAHHAAPQETDDQIQDEQRGDDQDATDRPIRDDQPAQRPPRSAVVRVPPGVEFMPDVVYATTTKDNGESHDLAMNVFFPKQSGEAPIPAIIYIHGGGWSGGDKSAGDMLCAPLAEGGYFACTISYRLTGDARFPACLHDVKAAVRFLWANADELGIDPQRIGVWGHSAGGHLAAFLGTSGNNADTDGDVGDFDDAPANVACVVDFFGPADLTNLGRGRAGRILDAAVGEGAARETLADYSPITHIDADDPPILIIHGDQDQLVSVEQSRSFHAALTEAGVTSELIVVEGAGHGIRDGDVLVRAAAFFDEHLGGAAASVVERYTRALERATDRARGQGGQRDRRDRDR